MSSRFELPFIQAAAARLEYQDPARWEASLKRLIRFRVVDIEANKDQPFSVANSVLSCGQLAILSVDAPTPFECTQYEHDFATIYLPYRNFSAWSDGECEVIGRNGESVVFFPAGAELGVRSGNSAGVLVMVPAQVLVQSAIAMSRGSLFASVIRARLQRTQVWGQDGRPFQDLIQGLYGCLFALDGVFSSSPENVSFTSLDDVFLRILMLLLFPELNVLAQAETAYKPKLVRMKETEDWILAHLASPISLTQLEVVSGYSARTLQDYFVSQHQLSPKQWIIKQRLKKALRLLAEGDERPMLEIAADCGYRDPSRFAKHFSNEFGFLPRHCRNAEMPVLE